VTAAGTPARVSVVVPVYNSAATLDELVERIDRTLGDCDHEIVLVNDGSSDASWERVARLSADRPHVRGLDLARNYGQHNALLAGIRAAEGDVIVTMDDDLQNPPEEIPRLLARLDEGFDVVYGRSNVRQHKRWRNFAARIVRYSLRSSMGDVADLVGPFRALRTPLRDSFATFAGPYVSIDVLLSWATSRFSSVEVAHAERRSGPSTYSFGKLAALALTMLTGFSTRPLRLASLLGLISTFLGVVILVYVVVRLAVEGNPSPGFPFLASIIAIFSGTQLLTLGIIGEYLGRVHVRTMDQPAYAIRQETGSGVSAPGTSTDVHA
jgi:undecaprenyl-phosphate 4-deoxy-4-formamido-L-arabinose transferase